jgi:hypothetical protein
MNWQVLDVARYFRRKAEQDPLTPEGGGYTVWELKPFSPHGVISQTPIPLPAPDR